MTHIHSLRRQMLMAGAAPGLLLLWCRGISFAQNSITSVLNPPSVAQDSTQPRQLSLVPPPYLSLTEVNNVAGTVSPSFLPMPSDGLGSVAKFSVPPVGLAVSADSLESQKRSVKVVINACSEDDPIKGQSAMKGIFSTDPRAPMVYIIATDNTALANWKNDPQYKALENTRISTLFIRSEGMSNFKINGKYVKQSPSDPKARIAAITPEIGNIPFGPHGPHPFDVSLKDPEGLEKILGFFMAHYARPYVKVILGGCDLLSQAKSDQEREDLLDIVFDNLQIKSGYLYMGSGYATLADMIPASDEPDKNASEFTKGRDSVGQFIDFEVTRQVGKVVQRAVNRGFGVDKHFVPGGMLVTYYKDRLDDALKRDGPPSETQVLMRKFVPDPRSPRQGPLVDTKRVVIDAGNLVQSLP